MAGPGRLGRRRGPLPRGAQIQQRRGGAGHRRCGDSRRGGRLPLPHFQPLVVHFFVFLLVLILVLLRFFGVPHVLVLEEGLLRRLPPIRLGCSGGGGRDQGGLVWVVHGCFVAGWLAGWQLLLLEACLQEQ